MAVKAEKTKVEVAPLKPILFTCKICGETKPLAELTTILNYYPQVTACKSCAMPRRQTEDAEVVEEAQTEVTDE